MALTIEELKYGAEVGDLGIDAVRAVCAEALANREAQPVTGECDQEVYKNGKSACLVVIPKETAEVICRGISAVTGCKVDWHYIGGRVHIKALAPPAPAVSSAPDFEAWFVEKYKQPDRLMKNEDGAYKFSGVQMAFSAWNACRAAMLAQPVSSGYTLNSPEIPDGWVLCDERMPKDGDVVLVLQEGGIIFCAEVDDGEFYPDEFPRVPSEGREITHWMPLPVAPEGGNDHDTRR